MDTNEVTGHPPDSLRTATPADAPALARVINEAFRVEAFFKAGDRTTATGVVDMMATGDFLVFDGEDGAPAACVYVTRRDGRGYFGMLSVDPRVQKRGLARRMIGAVEERCRRAGCHTIDIHVVNLRTELPPYYRSLGYVESGTLPFPDPSRATRPCHMIVMTKTLSFEPGTR
jgi:GNAT superfamily N-acetyltransferase